MLRRLVSNRSSIYWPIVMQKCGLTSNNNNNYQTALLAMLGSMGKTGPNKEHLQPIPDGSSRYWELGNAENQCVCIGGMGPIYFKDDINMSDLIDFQNKKFDKLHIEMPDCPKLLATKLLKSFPKLSIQSETLRVIKLSYHKYRDQNKGKLDCLIAANLICKRLYEEGYFGFYSGEAIQNSDDELLFHTHRMFKTTDNEIHSSFQLTNGYLHINKLGRNDVGVVYTDCAADTLHKFRKLIEN